MKKTLGGDRIGAGKKMTVDLRTYNRSTHNLGNTWRSTMAVGTLVPFMSEVGLPGDTFDINLDCSVLTHPTVGPLFGSMKVQLDVYVSPVRLYQEQLHNNQIGIGMKMSNVKLPQVTIEAVGYNGATSLKVTPEQINPSSIFSYLNIRGIGRPLTASDTPIYRDYNAVAWLAYWDIYKNYYANKQEEIGAVIHTALPSFSRNVTSVTAKETDGSTTVIPATGTVAYVPRGSTKIIVQCSSNSLFPQYIYLTTDKGKFSLKEIFANNITDSVAFTITSDTFLLNITKIYSWSYATTSDVGQTGVQITTFPLANIDTMRNNLLAFQTAATPFKITKTTNLAPYSLALAQAPGTGAGYAIQAAQEGLALKTYQSDLFNNWLKTDWITGTNGISAVTAVSTAAGSFTIDTLNLSQKVYEMLNRIAISGGTYDDWLETVWTHENFRKVESPMYVGGLSKELVFQEVIANSAYQDDNETQSLGQLGGRGVLSNKHKGGHITVKIDEPSYIIGIVSITPRIDYSQGNKWDTQLKTMDDFHKPALDEIGFQDLITDQMAYWDTVCTAGTVVFKSAGKQPAWINYMTNVNEVRGNFAIPDNEGFMVLNRNYEQDGVTGGILDLTTYIDPEKYNHIFAQTSRDAQNYWVQIGKDITARRVMSAKIIPNI